mmetsp:Transcript_26688/g.60771  ORF Transcript_26688/g.60771 Transcript_26688/m.60771 type:complete len:246 (-) Transcript_26688:90-827(-)|eukprot:CAMPEP_0197879466 /NCGR_PEP_ID=MMETSP1439-20131203/7551_1 /TAXON_ID=66791 /ORGANISM="Gonyaulax spinifera, Strain CCMP409" /LENGTH=245 /DNA_ID=CAMNT_0043498975 /DNA_START=56 /DNA_END=793 /DNA_ORIENTATION=-
MAAVQADEKLLQRQVSPESECCRPESKLSPESLRQLRQFWLRAVIFQDTLAGRDKTMRFVQYLARCLSGVTGIEVFGNLLRTLALSRKTLRFGRQLRWAKDMERCWLNEKDAFNRNTTIVEMGSYWIYCCVDHACFAQRIGLLRLTPKRSDYLDRFAEFFWLTEVIPVLAREARALLTSDSSERKEKAKILLVKAFCDLACSIYFLQPAAWRDRRKHKAWCGFLGAITSAISIRANWPTNMCLEG